MIDNKNDRYTWPHLRAAVTGRFKTDEPNRSNEPRDALDSGASSGEVTVRIPTSENEAALMVLLGTDWLKRNAPHRLRDSGEPPVGAGVLGAEVNDWPLGQFNTEAPEHDWSDPEEEYASHRAMRRMRHEDAAPVTANSPSEAPEPDAEGLLERVANALAETGIYPRAVRGAGEADYEDRTEYMRGWNDALLEIGRQLART